MHDIVEQIISQIGTVVLGKDQQIRFALACLLAKGHLLIEDLPGVGKTTLAHTIARTLGLNFQRIQFTSDLLPADILGVSIYEQKSASFTFHSGPIFSQLILADEVNRATPKTQSALLEAMEEHQVTIEGETRQLPKPFFVIATQNPVQSIGTFPLPESQLDRFIMRIKLGFPDRLAERKMLMGKDSRDLLSEMSPCVDIQDLLRLMEEVQNIHVSEAFLDYLQAIVEYTRRSSQYVTGLSPRASLALLQSAKAWAYIDRRKSVIPEDLQTILPVTTSHRLHANTNTNSDNSTDSTQTLLESVPIP